jgi:hypothetical protein
MRFVDAGNGMVVAAMVLQIAHYISAVAIHFRFIAAPRAGVVNYSKGRR